MKVSGFRLMRKRVYVACWSEARYDFQKKYRKDRVYGDAFLFEIKNKEIFSKIWDEKSPSNVIFVHNSKKCAEYFANTYQKNTIHVNCPSKDAFDKIDDIEKEILSIINEKRWDNKDVSLAISAGPAGKVLVYRLSNRGYHCVDAGHCWDEPLEGI